MIRKYFSLFVLLFFISENLSYGVLAQDNEIVNKAFGKITDLSVEFVERFDHKTADNKDIKKGKLFILKPGKIRIDYKSPANSKAELFIADNKNVYFYIPKQKIVYKADQKEVGKEDILLSLLTIESDISDFFTITSIKSDKKGSDLKFKLIPKDNRYRFIKGLLVVINGRSFDIMKIKIVDKIGNGDIFELSNHLYNLNNGADLFKLDLPKDVRIESFDNFKKLK